MAETNVGKITQIIGAVLDIKFTEGNLPEIYEAIDISLKDHKSLLWRCPSIWETIRCAVLRWGRRTD